MQIKNKKLNYITTAILFFCLFFFTFGARADTKVKDKINFEKEIFVGLTEIYYGQNYINSNLDEINGADSYQEKLDIGRLNFYLKGKIKGRYLLTFWLDTGEKSIEELFKNLGQRKKLTPFEKIAPEKYYPVYGDSSSIVNDINTSGNLYVALESDNLRLLWGDFKTYFDKNNLIDFNKNMYGLDVSYQNKLRVNSFLHKNSNIYLQDKFELTGGMLYYLREDNIAVGSEILTFEAKDVLTDRVLYSKKLTPGQDYDINYLQGRVILKEKLDNLDEKELIVNKKKRNKHYLLVNYQLNDNDQDSKPNSYGIEGSIQLTEDFEFGITKIKETNNSKDSYNIHGYNIKYIPDQDTLLTLNWAQSQNILYTEYFSDDGGISFHQRDKIVDNKAKAWDFKYEKNIIDNIILNAYYTKKEKGFSSGSDNSNKDITGYGIEIEGLTNKTKTTFNFDKNKKGDNTTEITALDILQKYNERLELKMGLESNYQKENKDKSLTAAAGFDFQLDEYKNIYVSQQLTIFDSQNNNNNLTILGGHFKKNKWDLNLESIFGTKNSLEFSTNYQIDENNKLYTTVEQGFKDNNYTTTTLGVNSNLNNKTNIYSEYRVDNSERFKKDTVVGIDYNLLEGLVLNLDFTNSNIKKRTGNLNRKIVGFKSSYNRDNLYASGQMEYRKDEGNNDLKQLILNSKLRWQYNKEFKLLSKIEYIQEKQTEINNYYKGSIGFSYRPIKIDRLNLLGKYTYLNRENELEDIDNLGVHPAEKAQILSLDLIFDLSKKWQITEKIAYKDKMIKINLPSDKWTSSGTYLWINRLNYNLRDDIEIFGEYRFLNNKLADDKRNGFLLGGYKSFANDVKIGLGYNFTNFNDDLSNLNYKSKGWFLNLIKVW